MRTPYDHKSEAFSQRTQIKSPWLKPIESDGIRIIGQAAIIPEGMKCCLGRRMGLVRLKKSVVIPKFFLYQYLSPQFQDFLNSETVHGATVNRISIKQFPSFPIIVLPIPEQQRIVDILDQAFAAIAIAKANAEKNLQNARALFESHLNYVFTKRGEGWVKKRLEQIGKTQTGSTPKTSNDMNYGNFMPFIKPGDFKTDGSLDYYNNGLSEKGFAGARKVPAGSVLMVCIGATIGKCGYCDRDVTTNQQINSLAPNDGSSHKFVYYQMLTDNFQHSVIDGSGQATLPIINKSKWSALTVWLPLTITEQNSVVAILDSLAVRTSHLESIYQRKLATLEELKRSLLHDAFQGAL